jgi:hypothetical protein
MKNQNGAAVCCVAKEYQRNACKMALTELIYTSLSVPAGADVDVKALLDVSQRNNTADAITGLLLFDGKRYIQILEGEKPALSNLLARIEADPRHAMIELLHRGPIGERAFADWRMAYEHMPLGLLDDLAENMAVMGFEMEGMPEPGDSFGARLHGMFMDATQAAE